MTIQTLLERVGNDPEYGAWHTVSQEMIDEFAELTGDHQWIHVDVERSKRESPFGTTVAHGMLVQSMIPMLLGESISWMEDFSSGINLGSDKVRFTAPVRSGSRIRGGWSIKSVAEGSAGSVRVIMPVSVEVEGESKPACYAELVSILYP